MFPRIGFHATLFSLLFPILLTLLITMTLHAQVSITGLCTEGLMAPLGKGTEKPHFSWEISSAERNIKQVAYEIKVHHLNPGKKITTI
jgi:hypothetical protein